jgi:hypothetical protein
MLIKPGPVQRDIVQFAGGQCLDFVGTGGASSHEKVWGVDSFGSAGAPPAILNLHCPVQDRRQDAGATGELNSAA